MSRKLKINSFLKETESGYYGLDKGVLNTPLIIVWNYFTNTIFLVSENPFTVIL